MMSQLKKKRLLQGNDGRKPTGYERCGFTLTLETQIDPCYSSASYLKTYRQTHRLAARFFVTFFLLSVGVSQARIGIPYQMQLGNPSNATTDTNNHEHYLVQRTVFALDYDDKNGEPNWVSWDLTAEDIGPAKRSPFHTDNELPASFYHVKDMDHKGSGFDRGHMCPSADRTDNATDNVMVFAMDNIIPQAPDNNQGVWEKLESECRELARAGNELLIICGPAGFTGQHINQNGPVLVPSHTWKIVVVIRNGPGSVLSRITALTRVIAVNELESLTALKFFTAVAPEVAKVLKAKVDGQANPVVASTPPEPVTALPPPGYASAQQPKMDWVPVTVAILGLLLILCIIVLVLFFRMRPKR